MGELHQLDKYCKRILTVMTLKKPKTHFNELLRELKTMNIEITTPTLTAHLKHLVDLGYVTREEEKNTQYVNYSLNFDRISKISDVIETSEFLRKSLRTNEKEFFLMSEEEQIESVVNLAIFRVLEEIKACIDSLLEPSNLGKKIFAEFVDSPMVRFNEKWVIKKSVDDAQYRQRVLRIIEDWEKLTVKKA
jgi:DNA-binding HxlR family transcriptional regulator